MSPGVYKVMLTVTGELIGDCENIDTDELLVSVNDAPYAKFTSPDSIALGDKIVFDASASKIGGDFEVSYQWDFGNDSTATGEKVSNYYDEYGDYKVRLEMKTGSQTSCTDSFFEKMIFVNSKPVASAGENKLTSVNKAVTFNAEGSKDVDGAIDKYLWNFGDGTSAEGILVEHSYAQSGEYNVILTVVDNTSMRNNTDTDSLKVSVNNPPVPGISAPDYDYVNEEVTFDASASYDPDGEITKFKWLINGQPAGNSSTLKYKFNEPGRFNMSVMVMDDSPLQDSVTTSKTIRIYKIPQITLSGGKIVCSGQELTIEAKHDILSAPPGINYIWQLPSGTELEGETSASIVVDVNNSNPLKVSLIDKNYGNKILTKAEFIPEINTPPVAVASANEKVYTGGANDLVVLDATSSYDQDGDPLSFKWDLGDGNSATGSIVTHNYSKPGKYKITLTVSDNKPCDCSSSEDIINIEVLGRK
jgi:PKD repeat protein